MKGSLVSRKRRVAQGHAAGVGMFHNNAGTGLECADALQGGIRISQIVVGQGFPLEQPGGCQTTGGRRRAAVEGCCLVRVLPVAQLLSPLKAHPECFGERGRFDPLAQVIGDGAVVLRGVREGLGGKHEPEPLQLLGVVVTQRLDHGRVIGGIHDNQHAAVILGRRPEHSGAANIDVFDRIGETAVRCRDGSLEWIQVDHQ